MAQRPRIAMRMDASARIGTGHVRRCLSLAHALDAAGGEVAFFARDLGIPYTVIEESPWSLIHLSAPDADAPVDGGVAHAAWAGIAQIADAQEFCAAARDFSPDVVIVDHYAFDARWHDHVRAELGCRIVAIDDLADRAMAVDLVVDHNFHEDHRVKYAQVVSPDTPILGGPRYALLDPVYADAPRYAVREDVRTIGIFLGGSEDGVRSVSIARALQQAGFAGTFAIVATSANPAIPALQAAAQADPSIELALDLPNLAGFFATHDLQIGAGGGATWERFCIGAPSVLVPFAANQREAIAPLAACGVAQCLPAEWEMGDLIDAANELIGDPIRRASVAARAAQLVDGRGIHRVAQAII